MGKRPAAAASRECELQIGESTPGASRRLVPPCPHRRRAPGSAATAGRGIQTSSMPRGDGFKNSAVRRIITYGQAKPPASSNFEDKPRTFKHKKYNRPAEQGLHLRIARHLLQAALCRRGVLPAVQNLRWCQNTTPVVCAAKTQQNLLRRSCQQSRNCRIAKP